MPTQIQLIPFVLVSLMTPNQRGYVVDTHNISGKHINKKFEGDEDSPTYSTQQRAEVAVQQFIEDHINSSTSFVQRPHTFTMSAEDLINYQKLGHR